MHLLIFHFKIISYFQGEPGKHVPGVAPPGPPGRPGEMVSNKLGTKNIFTGYKIK